jgi:hypothetical protein
MKTITLKNYCVILRVSDNEPVFFSFFFLTMDSAIFSKNEGTRNVSKNCLFDLKDLKTRKIRGKIFGVSFYF